MNKLPNAKNGDLVVQEFDNELLIYNLINNKAYTLNDTSAKVFNACGGTESFDDLKTKYNFTDDLIYLTLDELKANDLIEDYSHNQFGGLSRREVVKRVGLVTMAALPVIIGITTPSAVSASSACAGFPITENQFCTQSCQCQGRPTGPGTFAPSSCCQVQTGGNFVCRENGGACIAGTIRQP